MSMDKATQERLLANVKSLNEKFRSHLPSRLDEIKANWNNAKEQAGNDVLQKEVYRTVHSLAGSAGTFGFSEVGTSARHVLNAIKEWQQGGNNIDSELIDEIEKRMAEFEQTVQTACNKM